MPPIDDLMGWLFKVGLTGVVSFFWWGKKEDKKLLDSHSKDIVKLKSEIVTEDKVREIITDSINTAIHPIRTDMSEIKQLIMDNTQVTKNLQIEVAEQKGYQKALKELKRAV